MTRVIYHMIIDKIIKKNVKSSLVTPSRIFWNFRLIFLVTKKKKKKIIINLFRNSLKNIHSLRFKYFHEWTPSSSREEILKIAKNFVLSRQGQESWLARRERGREREKLSRFYFEHFNSPNRGRIFLHEQLVSARGLLVPRSGNLHLTTVNTKYHHVENSKSKFKR